ncbi:hypothetical protein RUM43_008106 [Polyplax serrata]|uniref:Cation-transporting ATPase n=1 Tax=Polyplax serrata TaxID=468196 RepID=A0AAN8PNB3_POLSC
MPGTPSHKILYTRTKPTYCRVSNEAKRNDEDYDEDEVNKIYGTGKKHEQEEKEQLKLGDEDMEVYGYRKNYFLYFLTWLFIILTCGILRLVFHWCPHWMLLSTHVRCGLNRATAVLIVEKYHKHKNYYVKSIKVLTKNTIVEHREKTLENEVVSEIVRCGENRSLPIHVGNGIFQDRDTVRLFHCKKLSYYWDESRKTFRKLDGLDRDVTTASLHQLTGLTTQEQFLRRIVYGRNEIVIPAKGIFTLLWFEVLNPFYIFQVCSFILWFVDDYLYYAMAILIMSGLGIIASIIQTRKNQSKLRSTVHSVDVVNVVRGSSNSICTITTEQLVPGDVIVIPSHGCTMHCDAVLLGGNCIVNEAMLTGESVPVTKTPLPNHDTIAYDAKEHAKHTLFCGTKVIQTRYYGDENVYAVVIRTGFCTSKGSLVRSIMYPPPVDFKFEHDSYKFVMLLAVTAIIGFIYTSISKYLRGLSASEIIVEALDLITIAVPPALPAAMTVGRMYAQSRLQKKGIYCISPRSINVSGSIDCVCFDKTGTLTEDGLDMWGVVPVIDKECKPPVTNVRALGRGHILYGMVTCHSLTIIDGKLSGDPLDLKMFESTDWILEEPDVSDNTKFEIVHPTVVRPKLQPGNISPEAGEDVFSTCMEIGIIRQFPFSSSLQRMSVITKTLGEKDFVVYCKGSPEMILSLSKPQTVPKNFNSILREYTEEGYRVLAIGYRPLVKISYAKVQRIQREDVEQGLTLLGLVVLENKLKPQTTGVIKELKDANIRTIIVTGDNMMTALSVARDCGIVPMGQRVILVHSSQTKNSNHPVLYYTNSNCALPSSISCLGNTQQNNKDTCVVSISSLTSASDITDLGYSIDAEPGLTDYSFAISGSTWSAIQKFYPDLIPKMLTRGTVFARMSPDQKQLLVEGLQGLGYYVAMCGDGANDCGALKAANTGISLSDAESSVASPFTSKHPNISCIPMVIREGRAALVTSFGIFKYVASYSLIQFVSVLILYSIDTDLTDIQFLYIDLFIITIFVFFFGKTESYEGALSKKTPLASLISFSPVLSLFLHLALVIVVQVAAFYHVQEQSWFVSYADLHRVTSDNHTSNLPFVSELACYENYAVFSVSSLQYIILAVVFSKGKPYRKSLFANYGLLLSVLLVTAFTIYLILDPSFWLRKSFELVVPPDFGFRGVVLMYGAVNFAVACFIEYFIVDYIAFKKLRYRFHRVDKSKKKYLAVEKKMKYDVKWPVISKENIPEMEPETLQETAKPTVETPAEQQRIKETNFQRPNFEFGNLPSITDFRGSKVNKQNDGRMRRYSENSNNNVENEFLKMSVPNLSINGLVRPRDDLS